MCIGDLDKLSLVLWFGSGLKNYFYNDSTVSKSVIHCKKIGKKGTKNNHIFTKDQSKSNTLGRISWARIK